jgi:hypothetical protein
MTQPWTVAGSSRSPARRWTPVLVTQLVVVLAVLLSGVVGAGVLRGRADGGSDVLNVVQAASRTAAAQPTLRASYSFHVSGSGVDVTSKGEMLVDTVRKLSSGTISAPGLGEVRLVSSGGVAYVQLPGGRVDAFGKHWLSLRAPSGAASLGGQDPLAALKLLGDPKTVKTVGSEKVHGVRTTHYRVRIDPTRLGDAVAKSGSGFAVPPGALDQLKNAAFDLWLDGSHLPRRMHMALQIQNVKMSMLFEFRDYGQRFEVTLPEPTDVSALSSPAELAQQFAGLAKH